MKDTLNNVTSPDSHVAATPTEATVLQRMIADLSPLPEDVQQRLINTVCTFFGLSSPATFAAQLKPFRQQGSERTSSFQFSEEEPPSVKQFIQEKAPQTDVERVACLAYYLARYRSMPHVKTKDITALNTESAHRPFSNTALAGVPGCRGAMPILKMGMENPNHIVKNQSPWNDLCPLPVRLMRVGVPRW